MSWNLGFMWVLLWKNPGLSNRIVQSFFFPSLTKEAENT